MGLTVHDYRAQLQALLPRGAAWTRAAGTVWTRLLTAMAAELSRIDGRARRLIEEADPRTTVELLADWERVAGLPDSCSGLLAETQEGRRNDLVSKMVGRGGQSRAYFIEVAAALGFTVRIEEFRPFRVGRSRVGDPLTNGDWIFVWRVRAPTVTVQRFRVGRSAVGEPLALWGNDKLECRIRKYRPAHTHVLFAYGPHDSDLLLSQSGALLLPDGLGLIPE